ncbi:MAG: nuclease [Firmicutes bacterium]|nr:nuclease [Bacillota bacterium]
MVLSGLSGGLYMQIVFRNRLLPLIIVALIIITINGCIFSPEIVTEDLELTRVRVTRIVDGDTVYVRFSTGLEEKVRLIGVDAPEINHPTKGEEPFGVESAEYAYNLLDNSVAWLEFDEGERDQYGRMLAYLWLEKPEAASEAEIRAKMFNARLLLDGFARQVIFQPNVKYVEYFSAFVNEARRDKRGLWAEE